MGLSVVQSQAASGPVSLEIFGMVEVEDEPLELPLPATTAVQPTPGEGLAPAISFLSCINSSKLLCSFCVCSQQSSYGSWAQCWHTKILCYQSMNASSLVAAICSLLCMSYCKAKHISSQKLREVCPALLVCLLKQKFVLQCLKRRQPRALQATTGLHPLCSCR